MEPQSGEGGLDRSWEAKTAGFGPRAVTRLPILSVIDSSIFSRLFRRTRARATPGEGPGPTRRGVAAENLECARKCTGRRPFFPPFKMKRRLPFEALSI